MRQASRPSAFTAGRPPPCTRAASTVTPGEVGPRGFEAGDSDFTEADTTLTTTHDQAHRTAELGLSLESDQVIGEIDQMVAMTDMVTSEAESFETLSSMLGWFLPYRILQGTMSLLHDLGLPWWTIPMLLPPIIKFGIVLPFKVHNEKHLMNIRPKMEKAIHEMAEIEAHHKTEKLVLAKKTRALIRKYGFSPTLLPYRTILPPFLHVPFHLTAFVAIQNMYPRYDTWREGGFLWFENLAACDPSWFLPFVCCAISLVNIEANARHTIRSDNGITMLYASRGMSVLLMPVMCYFSAGFNLYSVSNILTHAVYQRKLLDEGFREKIGLRPYKESAVFTDELTGLLWRKKENPIGQMKPSGDRLSIVVNQGVKLDRSRLRRVKPKPSQTTETSSKQQRTRPPRAAKPA